MTLLLLLSAFAIPYVALTLAEHFFSGLITTPATRARIGLASLFVFTAVGHFVQTAGMAQMLPPSTPFRYEIIYLTGFLELLGAAGLMIPRFVKAAGVYLIFMLAALLPANIYAACNYVNFGGHGIGPIYLVVRVPFQFLLIWLTYWSTGQHWFAARTRLLSLI